MSISLRLFSNERSLSKAILAKEKLMASHSGSYKFISGTIRDYSSYQKDAGQLTSNAMLCGKPHQYWELWRNRLSPPEGWASKWPDFNVNNETPQKSSNLDYEQVKNWWKHEKELQEIENQKYQPERVAALGPNLAALHFFTYRQAAVRLKDSNSWITGNLATLAEKLPQTYEEGFHVEAIDCSDFYSCGIRYEGLQNLTGLESLKWLSLKNQTFIDAWALDRIAGQNGNTLEYLDISSCNLDLGCVHALTRMPKLHTLIIKDPEDVDIHSALTFLENKRPNLLIKVFDTSVKEVRRSDAVSV